jgi:hypothetical protein
MSVTDFSDSGALALEWRGWYNTHGDASQAYPGDDLLMRVEAYAQRHEFLTKTEEMKLLVCWYQWWRESNEVPNKLPNSLHVRTALFLYRHGMLDPETLDVKK